MKKSLILEIGAIVVFIFLLVAWFLTKDANKTINNPETSRYYPFLALSPITGSQNLYLYSLTDRETVATNYQADEIFPAPNYQKAVFKSNDRLWLINFGAEKKLIATAQAEEYFQHVFWSPDSATFVVTGSIGGTIDDEGRNSSYIYNEQFGLKPLEVDGYEIGPFINSDKILLEVPAANYREQIAAYDIKTNRVDRNISEDTFGFGTLQFNFSADGSMWAFTSSRNPTDDAYIAVSHFPDLEGRTIASGRWAEVQWPVLSPSGARLAYEWEPIRQDYGGVRAQMVDLATGESTTLLEGWIHIVGWLDENTLIVKEYEHGSSPTTGATVFISVDDGRNERIVHQDLAQRLAPPVALNFGEPLVLYAYEDPRRQLSVPEGRSLGMGYFLKIYDPSSGNYSLVKVLPARPQAYYKDKVYYVRDSGRLEAFDVKRSRARVLMPEINSPVQDISLLGDTLYLLRGSCGDWVEKDSSSCSLEALSLSSGYHRVIQSAMEQVIPSKLFGVLRLGNLSGEGRKIVVYQSGGDAGWSYTDTYEVDLETGVATKIDTVRSRIAEQKESCGSAEISYQRKEMNRFTLHSPGVDLDFHSIYLGCVKP